MHSQNPSMATSILLSYDNSYPSSSSSSMSSIITPSLSATSSNRHIRFAPLPDPRRPDDVNELPPADLDTESKRSSYSFDDDSSSSCPPSDSDRPPSPLYCPPSRPTKQQMLAHISLTPPIHWSKPKSLSLLPFPFKKLSSSPPSSTNSLTPTPSLDSNPTPTQSRVVSTENVPSLGSANSFRPSTKNDSPSSSGWGFALSRWSSPSTPKNGSPLARSQSVPINSTSQPITKKAFSLPTNATKPRHDSISSTSSAGSTKQNTRKGHRMLNGRVYGAKRHHGVNANPFANARDDDNEFVEWGYGGMGSVRGARSAGVAGHTNDRDRTKWERLQHDGRNVMAGKSSTEKGEVDEDDDGSGMGWVKKRKAARERKEKEEKEHTEAEAAQAQVVSSIPEAVETSVTSPARHPSSSSPTPVEEGAPVPEHIYTTVPLPVHISRHHRRVQSYASMDTAPSISTIVPDREEAPPSVGSDSEMESEDDYGDDEEEEEEEEEEAKRKTALGAGIEKISRHNN